LPANGPILRALALPDIYGITQAETLGVDVFKGRLAMALEHGLRLVQVREKQMPDQVLRQFVQDVVALSHRAGARVLINGNAQLARDSGADGVHLTSAQLQTLTQRPDCVWVAASCHRREEIEAAARLGADFVVAGPVAPTPTHPGAPVLGWQGFAQCVENTPIPVYALGGMQPRDLQAARQSGAQGVAMLRGAWR
jgi:8-oxo-dGTP diphosphatase